MQLHWKAWWTCGLRFRSCGRASRLCLPRLPAAIRDAVLRMHRRGSGGALAHGWRLRGGGYAHRDGAVLIVHRDPGRYQHFSSQGRRLDDDIDVYGSSDWLYDWRRNG